MQFLEHQLNRILDCAPPRPKRQTSFYIAMLLFGVCVYLTAELVLMDIEAAKQLNEQQVTIDLMDSSMIEDLSKIHHMRALLVEAGVLLSTNSPLPEVKQ